MGNNKWRRLFFSHSFFWVDLDDESCIAYWKDRATVARASPGECLLYCISGDLRSLRDDQDGELDRDLALGEITFPNFHDASPTPLAVPLINSWLRRHTRPKVLGVVRRAGGAV
jgi:hypothetical protein